MRFYAYVAALSAFVLFLLSGCGATAPKHVPLAPAPQVVAIREYAATMHADEGFPEDLRTEIDAAAKAWRTFTGGRVWISVVYDLDSLDDFRDRLRRNENMVLALFDAMPFTHELDTRFRGITLGATLQGRGVSTLVFVVLDRIPMAKFRRIVMHELGHVAGLPDLADDGHVMSGRDSARVPTPSTFTPKDLELCEANGLCAQAP